jgi:hypothetical protein
MQTSCIEPDNARVFRGANPQTPAGDNQSITFNSIIISATEHAAREAGLPGRVDRETTYGRSCGCETTADRICPACAEALRAERAEAQSDLLRRHGATCIEAVPRAALVEHQGAWGRC